MGIGHWYRRDYTLTRSRSYERLRVCTIVIILNFELFCLPCSRTLREALPSGNVFDERVVPSGTLPAEAAPRLRERSRTLREAACASTWGKPPRPRCLTAYASTRSVSVRRIPNPLFEISGIETSTRLSLSLGSNCYAFFELATSTTIFLI